MNARVFAISAHGDQKYGGRPYVDHLDAVARIVEQWGFFGAIWDAAYLHDVLEDTDVTHAELTKRFGGRVADLVWACTGEGDTREERMASIYAKCGRNGSAAIVKLADRIANLEASAPGSSHAVRYAAEDAAFTRHIKPMVPALHWARYRASIEAIGEETA